jgi:hypothetical protein
VDISSDSHCVQGRWKKEIGKQMEKGNRQAMNERRSTEIYSAESYIF